MLMMNSIIMMCHGPQICQLFEGSAFIEDDNTETSTAILWLEKNHQMCSNSAVTWRLSSFNEIYNQFWYIK